MIERTPGKPLEFDLDAHRSYLTVLARGQIPVALRARLDASDVVQETLLEAHRKQSEFRGQDSAALAAWLRAMLGFNLIDAIRAHTRKSRDVARELQLHDALERSAVQLSEWLAGSQTSPSVHMDQQARSLQLAAAIERLPEAQRDAILMRYTRSMTVGDIAETMGKSTVAVAGLLKRGTANLREALAHWHGAGYPSDEEPSGGSGT